MKIVALFFLLVSTVGCATRYQSQNAFGNGYSDIRTNPDSFIVNFKGNSHSNYDKILKYALKRAALLTLKNGFKYFRIVNTMDHSKYTSSDFSQEPGLSIYIKCSREKTNEPSEIDAAYFLSNNFKE